MIKWEIYDWRCNWIGILIFMINDRKMVRNPKGCARSCKAFRRIQNNKWKATKRFEPKGLTDKKCDQKGEKRHKMKFFQDMGTKFSLGDQVLPRCGEGTTQWPEAAEWWPRWLIDECVWNVRKHISSAIRVRDRDDDWKQTRKQRQRRDLSSYMCEMSWNTYPVVHNQTYHNNVHTLLFSNTYGSGWPNYLEVKHIPLKYLQCSKFVCLCHRPW